MSEIMISRRNKVDLQRQKSLEALRALFDLTLPNEQYVLMVDNKPVIHSEAPSPKSVEVPKVESKKPKAKTIKPKPEVKKEVCNSPECEIKKVLKPVNWVYGDEVEIETQTETLPARYAITELDNIIPSNNPFSFQWNEHYPQSCQTRNYLTKSEQAKVLLFSSHFKVSHVINDAPIATTGTPIVMKNGVVLGGNGRTMVLFRVQKSGEYQKKYVEYLIKKINSFGISVEKIKSFNNPVLVRVVDVNIAQCGKYSNMLNADLRQESDKITESIGYSKNLTDTDIKNIANIFEASGDMTFNEVLDDSKFSKLIENILRKSGLITQQNYLQWIDPDTLEFTSEGKKKLESILLGSIMPSRDLITKAKTYTNKLIKSLSLLLQMKSLKSNWNFLPSIQDAVKYEFDRRAKKLTINQYISQGDAFREPIPKRSEIIWKALDQLNQSNFKEFVQSYIKTAKNEINSSMFGGEKAQPMDVLDFLANKRGLSDNVKKYMKADGKLKRNYYFIVHNGKIYLAESFMVISGTKPKQILHGLKILKTGEVIEKDEKELFKTEIEVFRYFNEEKSMFADKKFDWKVGDVLELIEHPKHKVVIKQIKYVTNYHTKKPDIYIAYGYLEKGYHVVDGVRYPNSIGGGGDYYFESMQKEYRKVNSNNKLGDKMGKSSKRKFHVNAYRWRDKVNGNTYHSVYVYNNENELVYSEKFAYGGDEQYRMTALEGLLKKGLIPKKYKDHLLAFERENNYPILWNVKNVPRKKDLDLFYSQSKSTLKDNYDGTGSNGEGNSPVEPEKATIADKKKPRRKRRKTTVNDNLADSTIFSAIKKAWNNDPIVKWFKG